MKGFDQSKAHKLAKNRGGVMLMSMLARVNARLADIQFIVRNFFHLRRVKNLEMVLRDSVCYRGMQRRDISQVSDLYIRLNTGSNLGWSKRWLYYFLGQKILLVAVTQEGGAEKIIGMNMYYLNARDVKENTIHGAFIGVLPEMTGLGVATNLRQMAKHHFFNAGFKALSTRISLNNTSSLKSALKVGYKPLEKYYDEALGEERYYMNCNLDNS